MCRDRREDNIGEASNIRMSNYSVSKFILTDMSVICMPFTRVTIHRYQLWYMKAKLHLTFD